LLAVPENRDPIVEPLNGEIKGTFSDPEIKAEQDNLRAIANSLQARPAAARRRDL
jgi:hypothetical protein